MAMGEHTYRVVAAVEVLPQGYLFTSPETPRLAALVGAGYLIDETPQDVANDDEETVAVKPATPKRRASKE